MRDIPSGKRSPRYWWLVLENGEAEVCLKNPGHDVVVKADLGTFTNVRLEYLGLREAVA
jgi:hypothetical protein